MLACKDAMNATTTLDAGRTGLFSKGDPTHPNKVLLLTSCRGIQYVDYFTEFLADPPYVTIIDPLFFKLSCTDPEKDSRIKEACAAATVFIHEHIESYGVLNTETTQEKNIFQMGLRSNMKNISLPNFHNHIILEDDQRKYEPQNFSIDRHFANGMTEIARFYRHCSMSSFPTFAQWFDFNWRTTRLFWTTNHVTKYFTREFFLRIVHDHLHWKLHPDWSTRFHEYPDLFQPVHTVATNLDVGNYQLKWSVW